MDRRLFIMSVGSTVATLVSDHIPELPKIDNAEPMAIEPSAYNYADGYMQLTAKYVLTDEIGPSVNPCALVDKETGLTVLNRIYGFAILQNNSLELIQHLEPLANDNLPCNNKLIYNIDHKQRGSSEHIFIDNAGRSIEIKPTVCVTWLKNWIIRTVHVNGEIQDEVFSQSMLKYKPKNKEQRFQRYA